MEGNGGGEMTRPPFWDAQTFASLKDFRTALRVRIKDTTDSSITMTARNMCRPLVTAKLSAGEGKCVRVCM